MSVINILIHTLVRCVSCGENAERGSFPLCFNCHWTLVSGVSARTDLGDPVDSTWAMYRLNEENYAVLKSWKKRRGPAFDRIVLKKDEREKLLEWVAGLPTPPQAVTPIPQSRGRSFRMGGSPAAVLAAWVAHQCRLPVRELLVKEWQLFAPRQAELDHWHRLINPIPFRLEETTKIPDSVILVDDFITTGHTVREAARALKLGGVRQVAVSGLGARASEIRAEQVA